MENSPSLLKEITKAIISQLPIGISIYDCNGQCVIANKAIADIVGASIEGVVSQNYHEIRSWREGGLYDAAVRAMNEDKQEHLTTNISTSFGRNVSLNYYLFPADLFGIRHLVLMVEDITAKQQAIFDLEETTRLLNEAQQIGNCPPTPWGAGGKVVNGW